MENFVTVIRTGVKRITLSRTIVGKIVWSGNLSLPELHVLYQNQLWLEQKCSTDSSFRKKFGSSLEDLSFILKSANIGRGLTEGAVSYLRKEMKKLQEFVPPKRNMPQLEARLSKSFYTRPYREQGVPTKSLPPKKVIGKGYRDHGTAKNEALDGSPSWQEVASYVSQLQRRIQEEFNEANRTNDYLQKLKHTGEAAKLYRELETFNSRTNSRNERKTARKGSK